MIREYQVTKQRRLIDTIPQHKTFEILQICLCIEITLESTSGRSWKKFGYVVVLSHRFSCLDLGVPDIHVSFTRVPLIADPTTQNTLATYLPKYAHRKDDLPFSTSNPERVAKLTSSIKAVMSDCQTSVKTS